MPEGGTDNVDWECQNCGEFNKQPRDDPPTGACLWCGDLVGWAIAEHDRSVDTGADRSDGGGDGAE